MIALSVFTIIFIVCFDLIREGILPIMPLAIVASVSAGCFVTVSMGIKSYRLIVFIGNAITLTIGWYLYDYVKNDFDLWAAHAVICGLAMISILINAFDKDC